MTVHSAVAPEAQPATRVNPVTAAVIHGALENITIEMGHKLTRMAYSSIIHESEDFVAALTDAEGGQLCECKMSTPSSPGLSRDMSEGFERNSKGAARRSARAT
ncbi:MAG: hydantoinase B/oxoprolinase family protein [Roseiarcus sp.]